MAVEDAAAVTVAAVVHKHIADLTASIQMDEARHYRLEGWACS